MAKLEYILAAIFCIVFNLGIVFIAFFTKSHGFKAFVVCFYAGLASVVFAYLFKDRSKFVVVPLSLIFALMILAYALKAQSIAYVLASVIVFSMVIAELIYVEYIVKIKINDIGVVAPLAVGALLFFINFGVISSNILQELYGVILQAYLALLGIVFMLGSLLIETRKWPNPGSLKRTLRGFASFFILVALLALTGLLTAHSDVNLSHPVLFSQADVLSPNTLSAILLVGTLCLFVSSLAYLFVLFTIFLGEQSEKNG